MPTREILEPPADFAIDRETLAYIVLKARAFSVVSVATLTGPE